MESKLYIRADGSSQIGLGHLVRCMALAQMLKDEFDIHFVCKEIPESLEKEIQRSGFLLNKISDEPQFFNLLSGDEIVILDHYGLNSDYQKKIKEIGCKLVCIDDLHDKEFYADLIINHAPGIKREDYKAQPHTQFALGLDYVLLRPAFLEAAKKERIHKANETIFICFGGSDFKNLTNKILAEVLKFNLLRKIIVVTGSAFSHLTSLESILNFNSKVHHYHDINEKEMVKLMIESDLAIVPASGILFEVLATKCKVISGTYIDNQKIFFDSLYNLGVSGNAGNFEKNSIKKAIIAVLKNDWKNENLIDGKSKERILKLFLDAKNSNSYRG